MELIFLSLVLALFASTIHGLSMSYMMSATSPRECFYINVDDDSHDFHIYFALSDASNSGSSHTPKVDVSVYNPRGQLVLKEDSVSKFDRRVDANRGRWRVCLLQNSYLRKTVADFDATLRKKPGHENTVAGNKDAVDAPVDATTEMAKKLESVGNALTDNLQEMLRTLHRLKDRKRKHRQTVENILSYIKNFSVFEVLLMVGMGALEVVILRSFFTSTGAIKV